MNSETTPVRDGRHGDHGEPRGTVNPVTGTLRATAGRLSWGFADQAVSSLTNFAVGLVVARNLGLADFGIFTLVLVTYGVFLNVSRGLGTDPLLVRFSGVSAASWRAAVPGTCGVALVIGVLGGAVSVVASLLMPSVLADAFLALGLVLPILLLQDSWRFANFAAGHGRQAFLNDALWAVALVPAVFIALAGGSVFAFVIAWGVSSGAGAVYGCLQTRLAPSVRGACVWLRQHVDLGARYLVENVSNSGAAQLRMYGLGAIAGLADVGAVRGAQLSFGPLVALLMGIGLGTVPEAVRMLHRSRRSLRLFSLGLGTGQAAIALGWGLGLLLVLPDSLGERVLGSILWQAASPLILPVMLAIMGTSLSGGAIAALRALGAARRSMRSQLIESFGYLVGGLGGAFVGGALGSSWGVAITSLASAVIWWTQLSIELRESGATDEPGDGVSDRAGHTAYRSEGE